MLKHLLPRRFRRGANAIEFGLTAPVFFAIVLGLMDYGWLFANQAGLNNAASMGCRDGALIDSHFGSPVITADIEMQNRGALFCGGGACSYSVTDLNSGAHAVPNRTLRCEVTMPWSGLIGLVPMPAVISSTSFYRLEWQHE